MPSYRIAFETTDPIETPLGETDTIELSAVNPIDIEPKHSAMGIWTVSAGGVSDEQAQAFEAFATVKAETFIYVTDPVHGVDETLAFRGVLHNTSYQEETGELHLEGEDSSYYLIAGSDDVHYENEVVADAIEDYWSRVGGFDAEVDEPDARTVAEDIVVQSADDEESFEALFGDAIDANTPLAVTENGIEILQTAFIATNFEAPSHRSITGEDEFTGGVGAFVEDTGDQIFAADWNGELEYTIPGEHVGFATRGFDDGDGPDGTIDWHDDTLTNIFMVSIDLDWQEFSIFADYGDLGPGSIPGAEFQATQDGDGPSNFDAVVVYDKRYYDIEEFDNAVHEPEGHLDNPESFASATAVTDNTDAGNQIDSVAVDIAINNTDGDQRLQVSFDGGDVWLPDDGTESNTDSIAVENDDVATLTVQSRVRLSGYSPDGAQDATPRFGYEAQSISEWELRADLSSLGVIEDQRLDADHLTNLQELHSMADYRFTLIPSEGEDIKVRSYQRGSWELDASWKAISRRRNRTTEDYWNAVTVKGPRDGETGERPTTTREDTDEIARVGERLEKTVTRNDLLTEADRSTLATQELLAAIDAKEVTGEIEAAPTLILPGPRYYVEAWDAWVDLEKLQYADQYGGGNASLTFDKRAMLVDRLNATQGDLSREKR